MPPLFFCGIKQMPYSPMGKYFLENRSFGLLLCKEKPFLFANRFFPDALKIVVYSTTYVGRGHDPATHVA